MATSFVNFGEYGFWVSDAELELWLSLLADQVNELPQAPLWLQEAGENWQLASQGICTGCVYVGLDEYVTTPQRTRELITICAEAQKSGPDSGIAKLAVQFIKLLKGEITSTASSQEALPNVWKSSIRLSEQGLRHSSHDYPALRQTFKLSNGRMTNFLGHSPLPQPDNAFTFPKYKGYIREATRVWWRAKEAYLANRPDWDHIRQTQLKPLLQQYLSRLPVYLLARCPICGGKVSESVDTFSFNGFGWNNVRMEPAGRGWLGVTRLDSLYFYPGPSYRSECDHVQLVLYGVNLNGCEKLGDLGWNTIFIGSERPYVVPPLLEIENSFVVMHSLPLGRLLDKKPTPRYTIYFTTYFTSYPEEFDRALEPYRSPRVPSKISAYDAANYDLSPWVREGRLHWLDNNDPELNLMRGPRNLPAFPYKNVQGREGRWCLTTHRMETYTLRQLGTFSQGWYGY